MRPCKEPYVRTIKELSYAYIRIGRMSMDPRIQQDKVAELQKAQKMVSDAVAIIRRQQP